mgnify:CR=1 FL=1
MQKPLTQKQRHILLEMYRGVPPKNKFTDWGYRLDNNDILSARALEKHGFLVIDETPPVMATLTQAGWDRGMMLELNVQRRG